MSDSACEACLRRAGLLERLAPLIELVATGRPGGRSRELLALPEAELVRALVASDSERGRRHRDALERGDGDRDSPSSVRERARAAGLWSGCRHRGPYPGRLADLGAEAPAALFGRGDPDLLARLDAEPTATIVGTRRASPYGREVASELARMLAHAGVPVLSGMAHGIDSAAHAGALSSDGATVAVLGGGADRASPAGQRRLYARIAERGLVLSELPPGARPYRWSFPARNRIMAALGTMTVVVEAATRSGSLITAEMASDLGRELGAVPGPVDSWRSEGANRMLADGAAVVRGAQDVLDVLFGPGARRVEEAGPPLDEWLRAVLDAVEGGARSPDAVASSLRAGPSEVATALARLELLGYLRAGPGGRYARAALSTPVSHG